MPDRRPVRLLSKVTSLLVVGAVLGACGGSSTGTTNTAENGSSPRATSPADGGSRADPSNPDEMAAARTAEVLAMSPDDRNAAAAEAGLEMELAVAKESGLEAELGGPDATRAALIAAWAPIVAQAFGVAGAAPALGFRRAAPGIPSIGEGLFGGLMVTSLGAGAAVGATSDLPAGPPVSETKGDFTITGSQNYGELTMDTTHVDDSTGVTTKLVTKVSVVPCPDADGRFEAHATMDVAVSKGSAGQHGVLQVDLVGQVDDDAHLASSEIDYDLTWTQGSGGATELARVSVKGSTGAQRTSHTGGATNSTLEQSATVGAQLYAILVQDALERAAQQGWESGRCVELGVTANPAGKMVRPGQTAEVTAAPRSKIDGGPVGGTVTATLDGRQAIEPSGSPLPADATFVYTAPTDQLPSEADVLLEARSRRGVGKAKIRFGTDATPYVASGGAGGITFSGTVRGDYVDDLLTFEVHGEFVGGSATFEISPDIDADGNRLSTGVVTITGGGSGATVTGSGTFVMTVNDDGTVTVTMQNHSCVDVSGACRDTADVVTLTPQSS